MGIAILEGGGQSLAPHLFLSPPSKLENLFTPMHGKASPSRCTNLELYLMQECQLVRLMLQILC